MEKRKDKRIKRRLNAVIELDGKSFRAIAMDFSESGLFLQGRCLFNVGTPFTITLQMKPEVQIKVNAVVRSIRQGAHLPGMPAVSGIGVEIFAPPPEYVEYVSTQKV